MRILYHHRIRSMDGQYVHVEEMVTELEKLGHSVFISGPAATESASFGSDSGSLILLKKHLPGAVYEFLELGYSLVAFTKLVRAIRKYRPNVIYERFNLFTPSGIWAKKLFGLPLISEVNAPLLEERSAYGGLRMRRLARWSQRYVWKNADSVITVTNVLRKIIADYDVDSQRIVVMANGVDGNKFRFSESTRSSTRISLGVDGKVVLGFTGFVREWHKLENVLDLLPTALFENAVLLVVGDGPAVPHLQEHAARLGVADRLIVTGVVPRQAVGSYICAFDIAMQPSVVSYASPLKLIEYLALGRAIVAPRSPNIEEILEDRRNAVLFAKDSAVDFRKALELIVRDRTLQRSLEKEAAVTIERRGLTWESNAKWVTEIAQELCEGPLVPEDVSSHSDQDR